jgi:HlyD family secretion protein
VAQTWLVETEAITQRAIASYVEDEGKSGIREVFTVSAPTAGQLLRLSLHAGDEVLAGQTIVALIKPAQPILLDVRSKKVAEANVEAAKAAIDLEEAQFRNGAEWAVFTVKDNVAHLQNVNLGQRNFDYAEALDGLETGAKVILHPSDAIGDGTKVAESGNSK